MTTINVPETATVQIRKTSLEVTGLASWPKASLDKVFAYGLQQILNDAAAPAKSPEEVGPLVAKRIANLAAGILRSASARIGDPVAREALRIATERVVAALKKASREAKPAEIRKLAVELIAKRPEITEVAKANVAASAALDVDVDLSDLDESADDAEEEVE